MLKRSPGLQPDQGQHNPWVADLRLRFKSDGGRTVPAERWHAGPLLVQRPFYPEGDVCHVYLLHPPSGIVGGDVLNVQAKCGNGTHALLTTPAAAKFYRSNGRLARQSVMLSVDAGATLEWLPQEAILFDGARIDSNLRVKLEAGATFIGWDIVSLGRPACGERFDNGSGNLNLKITQGGKPILIERTRLGNGIVDAPCGMRRQNVVGTLIATPASVRELETARDVIDKHAFAGATLVGGLLVCRALGTQARNVLELFIRVWKAIRPMLCRRAACPPRIWAT